LCRDVSAHARKPPPPPFYLPELPVGAVDEHQDAGPPVRVYRGGAAVGTVGVSKRQSYATLHYTYRRHHHHPPPPTHTHTLSPFINSSGRSVKRWSRAHGSSARTVSFCVGAGGREEVCMC
jgi:hypothetical protein